MSGKGTGDHLLNGGPKEPGGKGKGGRGGRQRRRFSERNAPTKTDMGRDELFRQKLGLVQKSHRIRMAKQGEDQ